MKPWTIRLGLILLFLAGMLCGAVGMGMYVKHRVRQMMEGGPEVVTRLIVNRLDADLKLTDGQRAEVERIVISSQARLREYRVAIGGEALKVTADCVEQMKPLLTPAQQEELDRRFEQAKKRWFAEIK